MSIASFVAVNQTDKIPAYVQSVQTNLANAIPGIIKSIQAEVAYDQNLFSTIGATPAAAARPSAHDVNAIVAGASGTQLLKLLTFPIHNAYGIAVGVGTAANAVLNLALLPVSIASFVAVNQTDKIPAYVQSVQTNLANAIPGIIKSIQTEVDYDKGLFSSLGTAAVKQPAALESAPQVTKTAAGTDADGTKAAAKGENVEDGAAASAHDTKDGAAAGKGGTASDEDSGNTVKPVDSTPAKDGKADQDGKAAAKPAKDGEDGNAAAKPAKDGKPGKTDGAHHHDGGSATGTNNTTNGQSTGGAAKPAKSKTNGTHHEHTGAAKHSAGSSSHGGHSGK